MVPSQSLSLKVLIALALAWSPLIAVYNNFWHFTNSLRSESIYRVWPYLHNDSASIRFLLSSSFITFCDLTDRSTDVYWPSSHKGFWFIFNMGQNPFPDFSPESEAGYSWMSKLNDCIWTLLGHLWREGHLLIFLGYFLFYFFVCEHALTLTRLYNCHSKKKKKLKKNTGTTQQREILRLVFLKRMFFYPFYSLLSIDLIRTWTCVVVCSWASSNIVLFTLTAALKPAALYIIWF